MFKVVCDVIVPDTKGNHSEKGNIATFRQAQQYMKKQLDNYAAVVGGIVLMTEQNGEVLKGEQLMFTAYIEQVQKR